MYQPVKIKTNSKESSVVYSVHTFSISDRFSTGRISKPISLEPTYCKPYNREFIHTRTNSHLAFMDHYYMYIYTFIVLFVEISMQTGASLCMPQNEPITITSRQTFGMRT